jgi:hypothetical protein
VAEFENGHSAVAKWRLLLLGVGCVTCETSSAVGSVRQFAVIDGRTSLHTKDAGTLAIEKLLQTVYSAAPFPYKEYFTTTPYIC